MVKAKDSKQRHKSAVITVVGKDRVGIIAAVATLLAESGVNINDISQTIMQGIFTMIMIVDLSESSKDIKALAAILEAKGEEMGISIRIQHSDIFDAMHRI
ncbi:MAG: ACT domain-containing protein [Ruminococcaceae bacterium]|nr:ACT domain-containing protein [Oscillospiraceae bacterium]